MFRIFYFDRLKAYAIFYSSTNNWIDLKYYYRNNNILFINSFTVSSKFTTRRYQLIYNISRFSTEIYWKMHSFWNYILWRQYLSWITLVYGTIVKYNFLWETNSHRVSTTVLFSGNHYNKICMRFGKRFWIIKNNAMFSTLYRENMCGFSVFWRYTLFDIFFFFLKKFLVVYPQKLFFIRLGKHFPFEI